MGYFGSSNTISKDFITIAATILFIIAIHLIASDSFMAAAQSSSGTWTSPYNLFETEGLAYEAEVIADPFGTVHVFWAYGAPNAEEEGWAQSIYYACLKNDVWTEPLDVLVSPGDRGARAHSVALDSQGYLHILWSGGDALFYSSAYASNAGRASGWTTPAILASGASILEPSIAVGPDNSLHALWTQAGTGLVFAYLGNDSQEWSIQQTVFQANLNNELARWGRIAVDGAGRIHVTLTYTVNDPKGRYGRTDANLLYYLHSDDTGATWSEPFLVTPKPDFGEINIATFEENIVHLVWNGRAGHHGRYHRWSQDGGETWSTIDEFVAPAPVSSIGDGGLTGFPALATDATGALHVVTTANQGNFYLRWQAGVWTSPVLISPNLDGRGVTGQSSSLERPSIAISQGNQLHAVFHDGFERIWHTNTFIEAPYEAPITLPTPVAVAVAAPTTTPATASPQPTPTLGTLSQASPPDTGSTFTPLLIGLAPVLLLVGAVVLSFSTRRAR